MTLKDCVRHLGLLASFAVMSGCQAPVKEMEQTHPAVNRARSAPQEEADPEKTDAPEYATELRTEDMACFRAQAWPRKGIYFLLRPASADNSTWLLTIQTVDQMLKDVLDNKVHFWPHETVFSLSLPAISLEKVADAVWLESEAQAHECGPSSRVARKLVVTDGRLLHDGQAIPTAGSTVLRLYPAPVSDAAAVISVDRGDEPDGSGDVYYHQIFWDGDGTSMGPPVRLALPRPGGLHTTACWTPDDQYVIYVQGREGYSETEQFCVVPVQ